MTYAVREPFRSNRPSQDHELILVLLADGWKSGWAADYFSVADGVLEIFAGGEAVWYSLTALRSWYWQEREPVRERPMPTPPRTRA